MGFACSIASLSLMLCLSVLVWHNVSPLKNPHLMHCTHEHIRESIRTKHLLFCFSNFGPNFKLFIVAARTYTYRDLMHYQASFLHIIFLHNVLVDGRARTLIWRLCITKQTTQNSLCSALGLQVCICIFLSVQFSAK